MNAPKNMKYRPGFFERLKLQNERFAKELAELMTSQGLYIIIGIGGVFHDCELPKDACDMHVFCPPEMEADNEDVRRILETCSTLISDERVQVVLADELPGAVPPRNAKTPRE